MSLNVLSSRADFDKFIGSNSVVIVHFYAPWAAQCQTMDDALVELSKKEDYRNVSFGKCEAEELPEISQEYKIAAVPTIVIFLNGKVKFTVNGANTAELVTKLGDVAKEAKIEISASIPLEERLKSLINKSTVMVFMKGNPQQPRCGFSRTLISLLNDTKVAYQTYDILQDEDVRQGLKTFSKWPTYPQIYVKGELIGGLDIIQELHQAGELVQTLNPSGDA